MHSFKNRETSGLPDQEIVFVANELLLCLEMLASVQSFLLFALIPLCTNAHIISDRVETEYIPPVIYQVGTGNGYHKASDLFRGAINESANGI